MITARRLDQLEETKAQCGGTSKVLVLAGDITDERFVLELFKQTVSTLGKAASCGILPNVRLDVDACRPVGPIIQRTGRWRLMIVIAFPDDAPVERRDKSCIHVNRRPPH